VLELGFQDENWSVLDPGLQDEDPLALYLRLQDGYGIVMETGLRHTLAFKMATRPGRVRFAVSRRRLDCVRFWPSR
jgi:hypothetical protein